MILHDITSYSMALFGSLWYWMVWCIWYGVQCYAMLCYAVVCHRISIVLVLMLVQVSLDPLVQYDIVHCSNSISASITISIGIAVCPNVSDNTA